MSRVKVRCAENDSTSARAVLDIVVVVRVVVYLGVAVAEPGYDVVDEHANVLALDALARVAEVIQQRAADVELLLDIRR